MCIRTCDYTQNPGASALFYLRGSSSNAGQQLKYEAAAQVREIHEGHSIVRFVPVSNGALYMDDASPLCASCMSSSRNRGYL
ncbi:hypothetical protein POVWA2_058710 [Plasmodium ovale wallikeri]|uniref:Uncharacterized protein n=1 Tax=Plasmodium ovale wallikeri TaxID=864142 RepID=A0A1A9A0Q0_PLAOA|nr:hypothetical protein POVWA2_058710 [Plasmodium ovale wallikeri]